MTFANYNLVDYDLHHRNMNYTYHMINYITYPLIQQHQQGMWWGNPWDNPLFRELPWDSPINTTLLVWMDTTISGMTKQYIVTNIVTDGHVFTT